MCGSVRRRIECCFFFLLVVELSASWGREPHPSLTPDARDDPRVESEAPRAKSHRERAYVMYRFPHEPQPRKEGLHARTKKPERYA
jgi:hypothetical protein